MKKPIVVLSLAALGAALLAGCNSTSKTTVKPTAMQKEIVSAALLANPSAQSRYLQAKRAANSKSPIDFDPNDVTASLASFDALSLSSYSVATNVLTSDKSEYTHEDEIVYTLPDGSVSKIYLYYNEAKSGNWTASSSSTSTPSTSAGDTSTSTTSSTSTPTNPSASKDGEEEEEEDEKEHLHQHGFRSGAFNDLLGDGMEFDDFDDDENVTAVGEWKKGIAFVEGTEYQFASEKVTVTETETEDGKTETEVSDFSSFALTTKTSFLGVEQINVVDGTEKETAYAYTSMALDTLSFERFLLSEEEDESRLVYVSPKQKMVINRFLKDNKTRYSLHVKLPGSMSFVGIYEKVVTTAEDGTESVSYQLVSKDQTEAPHED
jgi:hypothetical protein